MRRSGTLRGWMAATVMTIAACAAFSGVRAAGNRLEFDVREPFQIGSRIYPAGALQMRTVHDFTPSMKIQEVWAGEQCLGMMFARRAHAEVSPGRNVAVFRRSPQGHLVLLGYSVAGGHERAVYRLAADAASAARDVAGADAEPLVMVASN